MQLNICRQRRRENHRTFDRGRVVVSKICRPWPDTVEGEARSRRDRVMHRAMIMDIWYSQTSLQLSQSAPLYGCRYGRADYGSSETTLRIQAAGVRQSVIRIHPVD